MSPINWGQSRGPQVYQFLELSNVTLFKYSFVLVLVYLSNFHRVLILAWFVFYLLVLLASPKETNKQRTFKVAKLKYGGRKKQRMKVADRQRHHNSWGSQSQPAGLITLCMTEGSWISIGVHLLIVISYVSKRGGSRLRAVSYFSLESYCMRNPSTRAAKPQAAINEGVGIYPLL